MNFFGGSQGLFRFAPLVLEEDSQDAQIQFDTALDHPEGPLPAKQISVVSPLPVATAAASHEMLEKNSNYTQKLFILIYFNVVFVVVIIIIIFGLYSLIFSKIKTICFSCFHS